MSQVSIASVILSTGFCVEGWSHEPQGLPSQRASTKRNNTFFVTLKGTFGNTIMDASTAVKAKVTSIDKGKPRKTMDIFAAVKAKVTSVDKRKPNKAKEKKKREEHYNIMKDKHTKSSISNITCGQGFASCNSTWLVKCHFLVI